MPEPSWYTETIGGQQALEQLAADSHRAALTMIFARKLTDPVEHIGEVETGTDYQGKPYSKLVLPHRMGPATAWAACLSKASRSDVSTKDVNLWESGRQAPPLPVLSAALRLSRLDMTAVAQWRAGLFDWAELMVALVDDAPDYVQDDAMLPRLMRDAGSRTQWTRAANALARASKAMREAERVIRLTLHDAERMRLLAEFEEETARETE